MKIEIFDVEHGACSLITTSGRQHVMIDCGHKVGDDIVSQAMVNALSGAIHMPQAGLGAQFGIGGFGGLSGLLPSQPPSSSGWRPSNELKRRGIQTIDKLIISNYDEDHLSDLPNIQGKIFIAEIFGNPSISMPLLKTMKSGRIGNGAVALIDLLETKQHTFQPRRINNIYTSMFWVPYGYRGLSDTNNLSVVTFVSMNDLHMIFPGDVEVPAWDALLENNNFLSNLKRVNVFVASHHGRENGYHSEVFKNGRCSPVLVIISDKSIMHSTQESAASRYGRHASGIIIKGQHRKVLTTRNDGHIRFDFDQFGKANVNVA